MSETSGRLLSLLSLLQTPREWPGPELADRLHVTTRTVRNDVERLRADPWRVPTTPTSAPAHRRSRSRVPPATCSMQMIGSLVRAFRASGCVGLRAARRLRLGRQQFDQILRHRCNRVRIGRPGLLCESRCGRRRRTDRRDDRDNK